MGEERNPLVLEHDEATKTLNDLIQGLADIRQFAKQRASLDMYMPGIVKYIDDLLGPLERRRKSPRKAVKK